MARKPMTRIDEQIIPSRFQLMKACIPFLPVDKQPMFCLFLRFQELKASMEYYRHPRPIHTLEAASVQPMDILDDVKVYLDDSAQELVDLLLSVYSMKDMFQGMDVSQMSPEDLAGLGNLFQTAKEEQVQREPQTDDNQAPENDAPQDSL